MSLGEERPEDEGGVCEEGRNGGWRLSHHPTSNPGLRPLCLPGWVAATLGAAYQVRAEPLSLAVSAHYPTHPSALLRALTAPSSAFAN